MIIIVAQTIIDGFLWGLAALAFIAPLVIGLPVLLRMSCALDGLLDDEAKTAVPPVPGRLALTPLPYRYVWRGGHDRQGRP